MDKQEICKQLEATREQAKKVARLLHDAQRSIGLGSASKARDALSEALDEFDQLRIACSEGGIVYDEIYTELERRASAGQ